MCVFVFCANLWRHSYSEYTLTHACLRLTRPLVLRYLGTHKHPTQKWYHRDVILTQIAKIKRRLSFEHLSHCAVCLICMSALSILRTIMYLRTDEAGNHWIFLEFTMSDSDGGWRHQSWAAHIVHVYICSSSIISTRVKKMQRWWRNARCVCFRRWRHRRRRWRPLRRLVNDERGDVDVRGWNSSRRRSHDVR